MADLTDDVDDLNDGSRCVWCGRPFDRPSFYQHCAARHPEPTPAQRLVEGLIGVLESRKGVLMLGACDAEIVDEVRDELVTVVERIWG